MQNNTEMAEDCFAKLTTATIFLSAEKPAKIHFNFDLSIEIDTPVWVVELIYGRHFSELSENELKLFLDFLVSADAQVKEQLMQNESHYLLRTY